jgi:hypothetical protein
VIEEVSVDQWVSNLSDHPDEVQRIIDKLLARERSLRLELIRYKKAAKSGGVQ